MAYGIKGLKKGEPVAKRVLFAGGLLPLDDAPLFLSCVKAKSGLSADIHIFPEDEGDWILLLDASSEEYQLSLLQQKSNELRLLRQKLSRIWEQPMGLDFAGKLTRHILNVQESGERREVTVLSADILGFTTYSEEKQPDAILKVLNQYLRTMTQPILDEAGILDRVIGAAVMAIFGISHTGGPAPDQAIRAALQMVESVKVMNKARQRNSEDTFEIKIGIASGPAVLGMLGNKTYGTFRAIGHTVDRATILERQARPLEILVDQNTFRKIELKDLRKRFSATTIKLKGMDQPIQAFSCIEKIKNGPINA